MNADKIAAELRNRPGIERLRELQRECAPRREEISARVYAIAVTQPPMPLPEARRRAILAGTAAVAALDEELRTLDRELQTLDWLEGEIVTAITDAEKAAARAAAGPARRKLPGAIRAVHEALERLDAAIAEVGRQLAPIAAVSSMDGALGIDDDELSALLEARDALWKPRNLPTLIVGEHLAKEYPRAFRLSYDIHDHGHGQVIRQKVAPHQTHPADIGASIYR